MDELDYAYRALKEYRNLVDNVPEIKNFLGNVKATEDSKEDLQSMSTICKIDSDWVEAIEKGLPFVSDAVMEERQFVRSDGEVLPIEKIRSVGKDSISDLAKHSNYITRAPGPDGKIIPDKLMMPLKDNDYAVYENRFLYSLLVYLCQFIEIRLNEILAITGKYEVTTSYRKNLNSTKRHLSFELQFHDVRFDDPNSSMKNAANEAVDKIKTSLNIAKDLLMTPLMKVVSRAPMVHPPIVKTNVFKFDHNFKNALALYEFLQSYDKKGYTVENVPRKISPFPQNMSDVFAELIYLTSFLSYSFGNDLTNSLRKGYEKQIKKEKEEADKKVLAEIKRVSKDIKNSGMTNEQYVLLMEKGHSILEKKLLQKEQEVVDARNSVEERMKAASFEFDKKVEEIQADFQKQVEDKAKEYAAANERNVNALKVELQDANQKLSAKEHEMNEKLSQQSKSLQESYQAQSAQLQKDLQLEKEKYDHYQRQVADSNQKKQSEFEALQKRIEELEEEAKLNRAEIISLRELNHMDQLTDMTEEANFDELEKEKEAFDRFFQKNWKATKKRIRKEVFWSKPKKKDKKKKDEKPQEEPSNEVKTTPEQNDETK